MIDLVIEDSTKFKNAKSQFIVRDAKFIYFRIVDFETRFVLITATASDDGKLYRRYPDQGRLLDAVRSIFLLAGYHPETDFDAKEREFVSFHFDGDLYDVLVSRGKVNTRLGRVMIESIESLPEHQKEDAGAEELESLYRDLSVGEGLDVRLGNGVYLTEDGDLIER